MSSGRRLPGRFCHQVVAGTRMTRIAGRALKPDLRYSVDRHMMPPGVTWGCSDRRTRDARVPYDVVLQHGASLYVICQTSVLPSATGSGLTSFVVRNTSPDRQAAVVANEGIGTGDLRMRLGDGHEDSPFADDSARADVIVLSLREHWTMSGVKGRNGSVQWHEMGCQLCI